MFTHSRRVSAVATRFGGGGGIENIFSKVGFFLVLLLYNRGVPIRITPRLHFH